MRFLRLIAVAVLLAAGCATQPKAWLVGCYYSPPMCSLAADFELTLGADGEYQLHRTLPEGVGPDLGEGVSAGYVESGRWSFDGKIVTLKSGTGAKTIRLTVETKDGVVGLWDGEMFGLRFGKQERPQSKS